MDQQINNKLKAIGEIPDEPPASAESTVREAQTSSSQLGMILLESGLFDTVVGATDHYERKSTRSHAAGNATESSLAVG